MRIFYSSKITESNAYLTEDEARHCAKVLRKRVGDQLVFTDGLGYFYDGIISSINKNECILNVVNKREGDKLKYDLTIAISPIKNPARFEWFVEKAVEIGINNIVPLICDRTEKKNIKQKRVGNIIISASKQSLKAKFPVLQQPVLFKEFIQMIDANNSFIAHLLDDTQYLGKEILPHLSTLVLIGPEGGFTDDEIEMALKKKIKPVSLGSSRLRTETAGVVACQIVNSINELA